MHDGRAAERDDAPERAVLRTEFAFELPRGYVDGDGVVHRSGVMRLATAREISEEQLDGYLDGKPMPTETFIETLDIVAHGKS